MLFMSKTRTAPSPASAIAWRARPRRYAWRRRKSTRSSQSTCMRPGAGTDVTVKSDLVRATRRLDRFQPVRNCPLVGLQLEVCAARLQLQQCRKVLVTQAVADEADHELMDEGGDRQRDIELAAELEPKLEVLTEQVTGKGRREIEVDECRRLVAAEGRPHHAAVDEFEIIRPPDAATLGDHRCLGEDLGGDTEDQVVTDLH